MKMWVWTPTIICLWFCFSFNKNKTGLSLMFLEGSHVSAQVSYLGHWRFMTWVSKISQSSPKTCWAATGESWPCAAGWIQSWCLKSTSVLTKSLCFVISRVCWWILTTVCRVVCSHKGPLWFCQLLHRETGWQVSVQQLGLALGWTYATCPLPFLHRAMNLHIEINEGLVVNFCYCQFL